MKTTSRLSRILRWSAVLALLATLGTWAATGAHLGWTQTSAIRLAHDEITGIDYPVREAVFVAGVEVLAAGAALAAVLGGLSLWSARHAAVRA